MKKELVPFVLLMMILSLPSSVMSETSTDYGLHPFLESGGD